MGGIIGISALASGLIVWLEESLGGRPGWQPAGRFAARSRRRGLVQAFGGRGPLVVAAAGAARRQAARRAGARP
jgi:hypothetical protein